MADWALVVPAERYAAERLFHHDAIELTEVDPAPAPGDRIVLVAGGDDPVVFGLGRTVGPAPDAGTDPDDPQAVEEPGPVDVEYTHRFFDEPVPAGGLVHGELAGATRLPPGAWDALADRVGQAHRVDAPKRTWLVSLDLPIEAGTPAEAVRMFWSYVHELGPRELPAFVSPSDDELAMQAFVLGAQTDLDPEEAD